MKTLQEQHKQVLKLAWEDALRRTDTDQAIDVLKELDQYLSPAEAQTLQSSARTVFKEKLLQLGIQFRFAVKEGRWKLPKPSLPRAAGPLWFRPAAPALTS